jgi:hypothetical protein
MKAAVQLHQVSEVFAAVSSAAVLARFPFAAP